MAMGAKALLAALGVLLWVAEASATDSLAGVWTLDGAATKRTLEAAVDERDSMELQAQAAFIAGMLTEVRQTFTLHPDGSAAVAMRMGQQTEAGRGTWERDGAEITVTFADATGASETVRLTPSGPHLTLTPRDWGLPVPLLFTREGDPPPEAAAAEPDAAAPEEAWPMPAECPPPAALPPRPAGAAVDDIVGLRPGMGFDEVRDRILCREATPHLETAPLWNVGQNYGLETRQLLRAANGEPCTGSLAADCDNGGGFTAVRGLTEEIVVLFTGMPEAERAHAIWRRTRFPTDGYPSVASLVEALSGKYGAPHFQETESGMYNTTPRMGSTTLSWVYDPWNRALPREQAAGFRRDCLNGPKPYFATRHSWNSGCGLTLRAEILPVPGSELRASGLDVVIFHQSALMAGTEAFEAELAAAYEAQVREQGTVGTPEL